MTSLDYKLKPLQALMQEGELNYCRGYAEPGYNSDDDVLVFFANWNPKEFYFSEADRARFNALPRAERNAIRGMDRVAEYVQQVIKGETEWSDEWEVCTDCQRAVRTKQDSYSWQRYYADHEDGPVCFDCIRKEPDWYVDQLIESAQSSNPSCLTSFDDEWEDILENRELVKVNEDELENGWYGGQADDPRVISKNFREAGVTRFLFVLDSVGQFDLRFSVWADKEQLAAAKEVIESGRTKSATDPAMDLQIGLANATAALAELPEGEGVRVVKVRGREASARLVSSEDFIAGKALED